MLHSRRTNEVKASDAYDAKGYAESVVPPGVEGGAGVAPDWTAVAFVTFVCLCSAGFRLLRFGFDLFALHCMSNNLLNNIAKTKDTVQVQYKIQLRISMS